MKQRTAALFLLAFLLGGCNQILGEPTSIRFKTAAPLLAQDQAIITERLRERTSTLAPAFDFAYRDGETVILAKGAPPEATVRFLLAHRGLFEVKAESGQLWFSNKDIVDALPGFDSQSSRTVIELRLSADAAARVARLSSDGVGTMLSAQLDGERLIVARLSAPIRDGGIQFTLGRPVDETSSIATIVKTGALSFTPGAVQVQALGSH